MDPTVWLDGARPPPVSLIMGLTNSKYDKLGPYEKNVPTTISCFFDENGIRSREEHKGSLNSFKASRILTLSYSAVRGSAISF